MAVGARQRDIQRQFLTEAVMLSLVGGAIGVVIGLSIGAALIFWDVPVMCKSAPTATSAISASRASSPRRENEGVREGYPQKLWITPDELWGKAVTRASRQGVGAHRPIFGQAVMADK
jgi:hypothetical protein